MFSQIETSIGNPNGQNKNRGKKKKEQVYEHRKKLSAHLYLLVEFL